MAHSPLPPNAIAVVGMAGRFPGARDAEAYWRNVRDGVESITKLDAARLAAAGVPPERIAAPDFVPAAALFDDVAEFDAGLFGFSPKDAAILDPQHRHFLECCWSALEHAGHRPAGFDGVIGVFAGSGVNGYLWTNLLANEEVSRSTGFFLLRHTGNDKDFLTTRVSYCLGLTGPSVNVQTACSTSLVAIHSACQSLLLGECDMALAGGVTIELPQGTGYVIEEGGILSPDGHCRPFDAAAGGTVFGSAAGVVVLRRLADALADGDTVHAVVRGSAINNDGALKVGYLAPSVEGQARAVAVALALAEVDADTIGFIEAHGTGTPVGDPIEVAALTRAFRTHTSRRGFCALGSVKGNIGHTDTAAGVAGFIKAVMALREGVIPPTLHFARPNPLLEIERTPFFVNAEPIAWPRGEEPRRAAVNSLGVGGTNAFAILEEAPVPAPSGPGRAWQVLPLSGRSPEVVESARSRLAEHLDARASPALADVAWTLAVGRTPLRHRSAVVARTVDDAIEALLRTDPARADIVDAGDGAARVAFLFAGGGAQYPGMASPLLAEPACRAAIDRCIAGLDADIAPAVRDMLLGADTATADATRARPTVALPALFIAQYAQAMAWQSWGVRPAALLGHSMGEYTAACLAGVFDLADALAIVTTRARLFESLPAGAMSSVQLPAAELRTLLPDGVSIAAINAPDLCVASGPREAIARLEHVLTLRDVGFRRVHIDVAAHSAMLDPILPAFDAFLRRLRLGAPEIPFISNLSGTWIRPEEAADPAWWVAHLRDTVDFSAGIRTLLEQQDTILLEVGPGRTLATFARAHPHQGTPPLVLTSLPHHDEAADAEAHVAGTFGRLWCAGVEVDWPAWFAGEVRHRVPLPTYPFEHRSCWIDPDVRAPAAASSPASPRMDDWFHVLDWRRAPPVAISDRAPGTWLVVHGDTLVGADVCQGLRRAGAAVRRVDFGSTFATDGAQRFTIAPDRAEDWLRLAHDAVSAGLDGIVWAVSASTVEDGLATYRRALLCVQALGRELAKPVDLVFVTTGALQIGAEPLAHPAGALLHGFARVVPRELPAVRVRCIDVPGGSAHVDGVAALCLQRDDEPVVALRAGENWIPSVRRVPLTEPAPLDSLLRDRGVYLITGGLGGLGLAVAEDLARTRQARLVLVSRRPLPARSAWPDLESDDGPTADTLRAIRRMEEAGADVVVESADVTDASELRAVVERARVRWGEINGVIHAAGVLDDAPLLVRTLAAADAVLAPKVRGAHALDVALRGRPVDFRAFFSSVSALAGPAGQTDYAAANAFLDAWAAHVRQRDGIPTISVAWSAWRDVGMAARLAGRASTGAAHPFLDRVARGRGGAATAHATLRSATCWLLDEHRLRSGPAVLPGAGYLELARALWERAGGAAAYELRDVAFVAPFAVDDGARRDLRVRLEAGAAPQRFTVSGRAGPDRSWEVHATGSVCALTDDRPPDLAIDEIRARGRTVPVLDGAIRHAHLRFGRRWASLRTVVHGKDEALLSLALPDELRADLHTCALHPALLDLATAGAQDLIGGGTAGAFFVPASCGSLRAYGPLPAAAWSHVRTRPDGGADTGMLVFDVTIADAAGRVAAEIRDFVLVRVEDGAFARSRDPVLDEVQEEAATATAGNPPSLDDAIGTEEGVAALRRVLRRGMGAHVVVTPADPATLFRAPEAGARTGEAPSPPAAARTADDAALESVEAALRTHPAVQDAAALVHRDRPGSARTIVFIATEPGATATATELRRHVRPLLPASLVPATFVEMTSIPRRPDGAIDRDALPNPLARTATAAPPSTPMEQRIAAIWRDLLGVDNVGAHDNFLDIGGHSLLGIRALLRIEKEVGVRLHPNVLTLQTLAQVAAECDRRRAGGDARPAAMAR